MYTYAVNPQTGRVEMGMQVMGGWVPRTQLDYNYRMAQQQPVIQAPIQNPAITRAEQAYQTALAGMNTNPAYNQSAMFSGLSNPMMGSFGQPSQGMYGAGRFTGGLLGSNMNFSAPSAAK